MLLQGKWQGEGSTSSELIKVAIYMFEKNSPLADLVFKLVKLFYSYSVYFYEAESKVIFLKLQPHYSKNIIIKLEFRTHQTYEKYMYFRSCQSFEGRIVFS